MERQKQGHNTGHKNVRAISGSTISRKLITNIVSKMNNILEAHLSLMVNFALTSCSVMP